MNLNLVKEITKSQLRNDMPDIRPGCTVRVDVRIKEGDKSRIQAFEGLVIRVQGSGIGQTFTILRHGKVRRARLYYLRGLSGKAARIKEIRK